jgi:hypothetical protein
MKPIDESSNKKVLVKKNGQQLDEINEDENAQDGSKKLNNQK